MLELIVFAEEVFAEAALEDAAAKIPDAALAFGADHVRQRTRASVSLQTLPTVANERLAKVADRTHHTHACDEGGGMLDDAISSFGHALHFPALTTSREPLNRLTEVAKGSVLLLSLAGIAFHDKIAGHLDDGLFSPTNLLLTLLLLLSLLALTSFLFRHSDDLVRSSAESRRGKGEARAAARGRARGTTEGEARAKGRARVATKGEARGATEAEARGPL